MTIENKSPEDITSEDKEQVIAVDIETTGLNPLEDRIILISAYSEEQKLVTENILDLKEVLEDETVLKVFHNAPFDVVFLLHNGIVVSNYTDTLIIAQVLENKCRGEGRSLAHLSEKYLKLHIDKSLQHASNWLGELTEDHKEYVLKDAKVTFMLFKLLIQMIAEENLDRVLQREIAALPVIAQLKFNGMRFNYEGWQEELSKMEEEAQALKAIIREKAENAELNLESPAQLLKVLKKLDPRITSTRDDELKKYENDHELIYLIRKYKKNKKNVSAFGAKLVKSLGIDNRLRGDWSLTGTDTGRMSCKNPPLQAMPKASRCYFEPEEGMSFILADYKTIEIRILAAISKDLELLRALKEGEDLHKKTAAKVFGKSVEDITEEERNVGKILNFGIIYGMSSLGVQNKVSSSVASISLVEAERYRSEYFKLYPKVLRYQDAMLKASVIRTLGGRVWRGNDLERGSVKRLNYPIQAAMAEGLKEALILLLQVIQQKKQWKIVNVIHDEIILEVPDHEIEVAREELEKVMIEGMKRIVGEIVPIEIDVTVKKAW